MINLKEDATRFPQIDINDAMFKIKLYLNKITQETNSHSTLQKTCHLTIESLLKFSENQQFVKENYENLKSILFQKKSYYIMYIIDCLMKNNKLFMSLSRRDLENMFKAVWQKVILQTRNQQKLQNLKSMVKTWGIIFAKKTKIEQSIKKWLKEKYNFNLLQSERYQLLFQESYQKNKSSTVSTLQSLLLQQLNKEQPVKRTSQSSHSLARKIFQD